MTMWIQVSFKLKINIYWSLFFVNAISHNFTLGNQDSPFLIYYFSSDRKFCHKSIFQKCVWFTSLVWWTRSILTARKFTNLAPFYVPFIILNKYIQPIQVIPGWHVKNWGFWVRVPVNIRKCLVPGNCSGVLHSQLSVGYAH